MHLLQLQPVVIRRTGMESSMSYRFCFGASGSGKSRTLHNWILEQAERSLKEGVHARDNYVIIVPDQYSMQTQRRSSRNRLIRGS